MIALEFVARLTERSAEQLRPQRIGRLVGFVAVEQKAHTRVEIAQFPFDAGLDAVGQPHDLHVGLDLHGIDQRNFGPVEFGGIAPVPRRITVHGLVRELAKSGHEARLEHVAPASQCVVGVEQELPLAPVTARFGLFEKPALDARDDIREAMIQRADDRIDFGREYPAAGNLVEIGWCFRNHVSIR